MYQQVMKPFQRTGSRLKRLFETIRDEYWRLHTEFEQEGCSLLPTDVFKRSAKAATWTTCFIIFVTIPMIFYYRNFDELDLYKGLLIQFGFSWLLVFILVVVSSLLWTMTLITGRKIGGSDLFQRYIGTAVIWEKNETTIKDDVMKILTNFQKNDGANASMKLSKIYSLGKMHLKLKSLKWKCIQLKKRRRKLERAQVITDSFNIPGLQLHNND